MKIWAVIIVLVHFSCGLSDEEAGRLVRAEYERRVAQLKTEQSEICRREALHIAEGRADSIRLAMRLNPLKDTLYTPPKPTRPVFIKTDSTRVNSKQTVKPIIVN